MALFNMASINISSTSLAWIILVAAGALEVLWAYAMKQSDGFTRFVPSIVTIVGGLASFGLLAVAMKALPLGTAYMVWTGIGAIGAFVIGVMVLGEAVTTTRIVAAALIVSGLVMMKMSTTT